MEWWYYQYIKSYKARPNIKRRRVSKIVKKKEAFLSNLVFD
jgi:hypothetical protein